MPEDRRTNVEKLDDAGLVSDVAYEKFRGPLNALPSELVDEIITAFNAEGLRLPAGCDIDRSASVEDDVVDSRG